MATAFLHQNLLGAGMFVTAATTATVTTMPLENMLDAQPRQRARWENRASIAIRIDLGEVVDISCVALLGTTLRASSAVYRVRFDDDSSIASPSWDTGTVDVDATAAGQGNVIILHATSASGRYLNIELAAGSSNPTDVGRIVVGPLWRPQYHWSYGIAEGRQILDRRDRNPFTGAEFPVPAVINPRMASFSLQNIRAAEAIGEWRTMLDTIGAAGEVLWIPDDGLSQAELNARCIWGSPAQPGEGALLARANFVQYQRAFTLVERV